MAFDQVAVDQVDFDEKMFVEVDSMYWPYLTTVFLFYTIL
jgi:hypothetical protein